MKDQRWPDWVQSRFSVMSLQLKVKIAKHAINSSLYLAVHLKTPSLSTFYCLAHRELVWRCPFWPQLSSSFNYKAYLHLLTIFVNLFVIFFSSKTFWYIGQRILENMWSTGHIKLKSYRSKWNSRQLKNGTSEVPCFNLNF